LRIHEAEELPTHGGSLRIFAAPDSRRGSRGRRPAEGPAARARPAAGLGGSRTYERFAGRVELCRESLLRFLAAAKARGPEGRRLRRGGQGEHVLNFCNVTTDDISMVADRNPHKQSKFLPGTHIPEVTPEDLMRAAAGLRVDSAWNLQGEIRRQLKGIAEWRVAASSFRPDRDDRSMIFTEAALAGAFLIDMERIEDDRGFFARSFCAENLPGTDWRRTCPNAACRSTRAGRRSGACIINPIPTRGEARPLHGGRGVRT